MLRQPQQELAKVARFLGLAASPDRIATAIECSSPENMRKLETATGERSPLTRQGRKDMFFVRSATSGSWKSQLPEESISLIENECGGWMRWLGYVISCEQPKPTLFNTTRVCSSNVQAPVLAGLSADQPDFDR
jgi:hypothetical protein